MISLPPPVRAIAARQDGVVSRRQLREVGVGDGEIRTWRARRLLTAVESGVYVDHTGRLTTGQESWAAVLLTWPAVLAGASALRADGLQRSVPATATAVHVAVDARRTPTAPAWVDVRRVTGLTDRARWHLGPPRDRFEDAVIDVATAAGDEMAAVGVLAEATSSRRTTAARLRTTLDGRSRVARRAFLAAVLDDLGVGACSVLERAYLRDVERAHGLPTAARQVRASSRGTVYRDVEYTAQRLVVELDGRADHTRARDRDRDLDRDLDAAVDGRLTVRLGWGQVVGRPCRTAHRLDELLRRRGWAGRVRACRRC